MRAILKFSDGQKLEEALNATHIRANGQPVEVLTGHWPERGMVRFYLRGPVKADEPAVYVQVP